MEFLKKCFISGKKAPQRKRKTRVTSISTERYFDDSQYCNRLHEKPQRVSKKEDLEPEEDRISLYEEENYDHNDGKLTLSKIASSASNTSYLKDESNQNINVIDDQMKDSETEEQNMECKHTDPNPLTEAFTNSKINFEDSQNLDDPECNMVNLNVIYDSMSMNISDESDWSLDEIAPSMIISKRESNSLLKDRTSVIKSRNTVYDTRKSNTNIHASGDSFSQDTNQNVPEGSMQDVNREVENCNVKADCRMTAERGPFISTVNNETDRTFHEPKDIHKTSDLRHGKQLFQSSLKCGVIVKKFRITSTDNGLDEAFPSESKDDHATTDIVLEKSLFHSNTKCGLVPNKLSITTLDDIKKTICSGDNYLAIGNEEVESTKVGENELDKIFAVETRDYQSENIDNHVKIPFKELPIETPNETPNENDSVDNKLITSLCSASNSDTVLNFFNNEILTKRDSTNDCATNQLHVPIKEGKDQPSNENNKNKLNLKHSNESTVDPQLKNRVTLSSSRSKNFKEINIAKACIKKDLTIKPKETNQLFRKESGSPLQAAKKSPFVNNFLESREIKSRIPKPKSKKEELRTAAENLPHSSIFTFKNIDSPKQMIGFGTVDQAGKERYIPIQWQASKSNKIEVICPECMRRKSYVRRRNPIRRLYTNRTQTGSSDRGDATAPKTPGRFSSRVIPIERLKTIHLCDNKTQMEHKSTQTHSETHGDHCDNCVVNNEQPTEEMDKLQRPRDFLAKKEASSTLRLNFESAFIKYASRNTRTGELISCKNNIQWMKDLGIIDKYLTEKEAEENFKFYAGMKIMLNKRDYKRYLTTISHRKKLHYNELYKIMGSGEKIKQ